MFTAIAVAATLTLGVVALDASQSSPPAVAEFAPAALNQVKNAPNSLGAQGNPAGSVRADEIPAHGRPFSLKLMLPPLAVLILEWTPA